MIDTLVTRFGYDKKGFIVLVGIRIFEHPGVDKGKLSHWRHLLGRDNNGSISYKKGTVVLSLQCFRCNSKSKLKLKMKSAICLVLLLVATASAFQRKTLCIHDSPILWWMYVNVNPCILLWTYSIFIHSFTNKPICWWIDCLIDWLDNCQILDNWGLVFPMILWLPFVTVTKMKLGFFICINFI